MAKSSSTLDTPPPQTRWQQSKPRPARWRRQSHSQRNPARLPRAESEAVLPKLEFVRLKLHQVLHEAGETLRSAYFCNSGMFSVLNVMPDGKSVEVGLIGKEGFSGVPLVAGFLTSHTRTVVQAEATAFRIDADALRAALEGCPSSSGS